MLIRRRWDVSGRNRWPKRKEGGFLASLFRHRGRRVRLPGGTRILISQEERLRRDALAYLALHSSLRRPLGHAYWLAELAPLLLDDHRLWWKRLNLPAQWPTDHRSP